MRLKPFALALLASVAIPAAALAQAAAPEAAARGDSRAMGGLTAGPTDFGTVNAQGGANGDGAPNAFGVTRNDIGGGYMIEEDATKTRSTVTRDAIDKQSPTANPYQLITLLPGVNMSSGDNNGLNGGNIRLRGFNSDHIGLTIEGVPINDSGNYALYPQEYVDAPNIGSISIAQGSPDLDSPHIGATGGVINIYMRDPAKEFGGIVSVAAGSYAAFQEFIRVDSGQVGNTRAFLSYSHYGDNHWNGLGRDERHNIEFKQVWDIDAGNTVRLAILYNDAADNFYPNPSMAQWQAGNFRAGVLSALPSTFFKKTSPIDQSANSAYNYVGYKVNPFHNLIVSAPSNFTFAPNLTFDTTPYFWYGYGNGGGVSTAAESGMYWGQLKITGVNYGGTSALTDKILMYSPSITETIRPGIINKFTYTLNDHKLTLGYWLEDALQIQTGPFSPLNADGTVSNLYGDSNGFVLPSTATCSVAGKAVSCPTGVYNKRDSYTHTLTNEVFFGDAWTANDKLTIEAGAKQAWINRSVVNELPYAAQPNVSLYDSVFLPQAGFRYRFDDKNQIIASVNTTFHSVPNYNLLNSYSTSNGSLTGPINITKPETGVTFELGHRYQGELLATSITGFISHFNDMQISTNALDPTNSANIVGVTLDAGRTLVYGVDAEIGTRRWNNFRPYASAELLHTELQDNLAAVTSAAPYKADFLSTKGKQIPGSPNYLFGFGIDHDDGHILGNLLYKVTGPQYATFMNDERIPAFVSLNAMAGYRFDNYGWFKAPTIQLNLSNLLDRRVLNGVSSITTNSYSSIGVNGGTIKGSAPSYYVSEGFSAMLTMKAAF